MEITDFIQSKAVADYLKKIDYKFTPFEAAYVINRNYMNPKRTMKGRHSANESIIDSLSGGKTDKEKELIKLLKDFMALENKLVDEFYANDRASYSFGLFGLERGTGGWYSSYEKYNKISDCLNGVDKEIKEINSDGNDGCEISGIAIEKAYYDNIDKPRLFLTVNKEIICPYRYDLTAEESQIHSAFYADTYCLVFGNMKIPVPFKRGDILFQKSGFHDVPDDSTTILTLLKEPTCDKKGKALGLCYDGNIYSQDIERFDFEYDYYCGDFSGYRRFARGVSEYAKEKIGLTELFAIRDVIDMEEKANDRKKYLSGKERRLLKAKRVKG